MRYNPALPAKYGRCDEIILPMFKPSWNSEQNRLLRARLIVLVNALSVQKTNLKQANNEDFLSYPKIEAKMEQSRSSCGPEPRH